MAVSYGGKIIISDEEAYESAYFEDGLMKFRYEKILKGIGGVGEFTIPYDPIYEYRSNSDYPGTGYRRTPRTSSGSALRICYIRIKEGAIEGVKMYLGQTTSRLNLFGILLQNDLIDTSQNGDYAYIFSLYSWYRPVGYKSHKIVTERTTERITVPSDTNYRIFKVYLQ
jgi:hypothetical protein